MPEFLLLYSFYYIFSKYEAGYAHKGHLSGGVFPLTMYPQAVQTQGVSGLSL
jgi:hypothetical protein